MTANTDTNIHQFSLNVDKNNLNYKNISNPTITNNLNLKYDSVFKPDMARKTVSNVNLVAPSYGTSTYNATKYNLI